MNADTHGNNEEEWIGFDLDGTLAKYDGWKGVEHIGEPVTTMVVLAKLLRWLGKKIKILTARVAPRDDGEGGEKARRRVEQWCKDNLGFVPEITHEKDSSMIALFDDRAVAVEQNTGKIMGPAQDLPRKTCGACTTSCRRTPGCQISCKVWGSEGMGMRTEGRPPSLR